MMSLVANAQILYKISGKGLQKESYLLGTVHTVAASFVDSIPGANRVLNEVQQVCGELDMRYVTNPDTSLAIALLMILPEDSTANKIMSEEYINELCLTVKENYNIDLSTPQYATLLKLYPIMLMVTIPQLSEIMKNQQKATEGKNSATSPVVMDLYFQQEAEKAGKTVIGFEYYTFQIKLLTSLLEMPMKEQYEKMLESFKNKREGENEIKCIEAVYKSFDLKKIEEEINKDDDFANYATKVFDSRNEDWIIKMQPIMKEKSTLFVVGAGHLIGEKGLLKLLRQQGYDVTAVTK